MNTKNTARAVKLLLILAGIFLGSFSVAKASIIINEIMYAPESGDSEWMEIFNSGDASVDLSDWRFFNNQDTSAPLRLQKGSAVLSANEYAIITTTSDWDFFSGTVFSSSSFSLPNDSSKYNTYKAISNINKEIIDSVNYTTTTDSFGNGSSLQLVNGSWINAVATPNLVNKNSYNSPTETSNVFTNEENTVTSSKQKIKTQIIAKNIAFVGIPLEFQANTTGYYGEPMSYGKYFWNFGDGGSTEIKINGLSKQSFHTFFYPGQYDISLEYYTNYYSENPNASDKLTLQVIEPRIIISKTGNSEDFFVELTNKTDYSADISKWILVSAKTNFVLPRGTVLVSGKTLTLSPHITNFSIEDKKTLKLMTSAGELVYDYQVFSIPAPEKILSGAKKEIPASIRASSNESMVELATNPLLSSLDENSSNLNIPTVGFVVFVGTASGMVYIIRRKKVFHNVGDDFDILDE